MRRKTSATTTANAHQIQPKKCYKQEDKHTSNKSTTMIIKILPIGQRKKRKTTETIKKHQITQKSIEKRTVSRRKIVHMMQQKRLIIMDSTNSRQHL